MVLIAYYLAFCVFCCVCLLVLVRRDKGRTDHADATDRRDGS